MTDWPAFLHNPRISAHRKVAAIIRRARARGADLRPFRDTLLSCY